MVNALEQKTWSQLSLIHSSWGTVGLESKSFFGGTPLQCFPSHYSHRVQEVHFEFCLLLPPESLCFCPPELHSTSVCQLKPRTTCSDLCSKQLLMHNESGILTHCYSLQQSCHIGWWYPSTKKKPKSYFFFLQHCLNSVVHRTKSLPGPFHLSLMQMF